MAVVSTEWLDARAGDPDVRVIEVAMGAAGGPRIAGADRVNWKAFLWHATDRAFVTPDEAAARLGALGIGEGVAVVVAGDPVQFGTYAYWVLRMAGVAPLHLLDGGRAAWEAEGRPLAGIAPERAAAQRTPGAAAGATRIGRDGVLAGLGAEGRVLLDLRSVEEYRGESLGPPPDFNHGAERFGRIPGARHLPYTDLIDATGRFRAPEEMRAAFAARGVVEGAEVVMYCRLSHRASLGWTALTEVLGVPGARVYDGSWTEWGSLVGVPVER